MPFRNDMRCVRHFCGRIVFIFSFAAVGCGRVDFAASSAPDKGHLFVAGMERSGISPAFLDSAPWESIEPLLAFASEQPGRLDLLYEAAARCTGSPALYLAGLIALGRGEPTTALNFFSRIPATEVPSQFLYAPYRLQRTLHPATGNPFRERMLSAAGNRDVAPLIQARVYALEGRFPESLESYLQTNPESWTVFDVDTLSMLRLHAGLARDVEASVRAALNARSVPPQLALLLEERFEAAPSANGDMIQRIAAAMQANPRLRELAEEGAVRHLEDQKRFLEGRYGELLDRHRGDDPQQVADQSTILLLLSAARLGDRSEFGRWANEIRRRVPDPGVEIWLTTLQRDIP